jgi:flagellar basal body P-ring formation protein FlgA
MKTNCGLPDWRYGATTSCLVIAGVLCLAMGRPTFAEESAVDLTSAETIRATAIKAVISLARSSSGKITASAAALDPRLRLHHCDTPLQGFASGDGQLRDNTTIGVRCDGPVHWTVYVRVAISSERTVLTARHLLPRGSELTADDFEVVTRSVAGTGDQYPGSTAALDGLRLRLPLAAGAALSTEVVEQAPIVRRGQQVTLLARTAVMEIRVAAIAMSDGRPLQHISVQNQSTHQIVEAVVRSASLVEVTL